MPFLLVTNEDDFETVVRYRVRIMFYTKNARRKRVVTGFKLL